MHKYCVFVVTCTHIQSYDHMITVVQHQAHYYCLYYIHAHIVSVHKAIKDVDYTEYQYHNIVVKTISQYHATIAIVVTSKVSNYRAGGPGFK